MNTRTYHGIRVYNGILEQLKNIHDTEQDSLNEVRHYANGFPKEVDYNIASYGCLLVYYTDIRKFYVECGHPSAETLDADVLWDIYKRDVGYVATCVVLGKVNPLPMSMYRVEVCLSEPCTTIPIMEWIHEHKGEDLLLDHTHFVSKNDKSNRAIVSLYMGNGTLEDALSYCDADEPINAFEYKGMRRTCLWNCYYFEIDGNVYLCTF